MACNKCGHTKSSPCACKDHGLTTPCSFTNCTTTTCDEVFCYECVLDCFKFPVNGRYKKVWTAESSTGTTADPDNEYRVCDSDDIKTMLQRLSLRVAELEAGQSLNVSAQLAIAPVYIDNVATTSLRLNWNNMPIAVTAINIYQAFESSNTWTLINTITTNLANTNSYSISNLTPSTNYKYKIITNGLLTDGTAATTNSPVVYVRTSDT
jgi:hypothetical protein